MGTIKAFDLDEIIKKANTKVFVETGTLYGDSVDHALKFGFDLIISIEINESLAEKAKQKYANESRVQIIQGDSAEIISDLSWDLKEPVLWWLDAHFPGADAGLAPYDSGLELEKRLPLNKELDILSHYKRLGYKDVIICDDLWIFEEGPFDSGDFDVHCKNHGQNMTRQSLKGPKTLDEMIQPFNHTHNVKKIYKDNGYTVLLPK